MKCPDCGEHMKHVRARGEPSEEFHFMCPECGKGVSKAKWTRYIGEGWTPMGFGDNIK